MGDSLDVPPQPAPVLSLAELSKALQEATWHLDAARSAENAARRDATNALNTVNELQKMFGARVDELRRDAPQGSDWAAKPGKCSAE